MKQAKIIAEKENSLIGRQNANSIIKQLASTQEAKNLRDQINILANFLKNQSHVEALKALKLFQKELAKTYPKAAVLGMLSSVFNELKKAIFRKKK